MQKKGSWPSAIVWIFCAVAIALFLGDPSTAGEGVESGLRACVETIIPTMFPFFVLSRVLLSGKGAKWLSWPLRPLTAAMGIASPKAASAVLCGWMGGFAAGAAQVGELYRTGEVTKREGALLLVASTVSGPSFVAAGVGGRLLGNLTIGWILFAAQCAAAAVCAIVFSFCLPQKQDSVVLRVQEDDAGCDVAQAVTQAVHSTSVLCGYVTLFSFLSAYAQRLGNTARYGICFFLEVTNACIAAAQNGGAFRVVLCAAALSAMGASVFFQVRAFAGKEVSLKPLLISRLLHLPLMLFFVQCLLSVIPTVQAAAVWNDVYASRLPVDAACVLFVLCALVVNVSTGGLRNRKKRV